jgi:hypothetical protein
MRLYQQIATRSHLRTASNLFHLHSILSSLLLPKRGMMTERPTPRTFYNLIQVGIFGRPA